MNKNHSSRFIPLIISASIIIGILIGSFYANHFTGNRLNIINTSSNKLNDLLHIIDDQYVDKVDLSDLVEKAMPKILGELDPHSVYISAKDVDNEMESLKGSFSGIGIVFTIFQDTARVIRVVDGGPSEEIGLESGDRIVKINGKSFVGKILTQDYATNHLKGPQNSKVTLSIKRKGVKKLINYTIVRGSIPVKSIDTAYMCDETTGYIRINTFSDTTYPELLAALAKLHQRGFRNLIIDLRGNRRGYMAPAIQLANEFLPKNRLIGNRIPLLKKLKWREAIGFKMLYGQLTDKNNPMMNQGDKDLFLFPSRDGMPTSFVMDTKTPYMEYSIGVHNIFKILHIDYVRRLNYLNNPGINKWGLRFMVMMTF